MTEEANLKPSLIKRLPVELLRLILYSLSDVASLESTALSCRSFYLAFIGNENDIVTDTLLAEIGSDVLPEVALAIEASRWESKYKSAAEFCHENLSRRHPASQSSWTLTDGLKISKLWLAVSDLTGKFMKACFAHTAMTLVASISPTVSEIARINRAFCRFEIFRHLYIDESDEEHITKHFFHKFSPWENEQLASVHDYLVRAVSLSM
jgi:hypothetical protein